VLVVLVVVVARTQLCARARGQGRATHLIYSSPFVSPSRAQEEGSHLAIGATKAPLAVFERARSAHKKKAEEEGSHRKDIWQLALKMISSMVSREHYG
jgi:hypothetical protein